MKALAPGRSTLITAASGTPLAEMFAELLGAHMRFWYWLEVCEPEEDVFV